MIHSIPLRSPISLSAHSLFILNILAVVRGSEYYFYSRQTGGYGPKFAYSGDVGARVVILDDEPVVRFTVAAVLERDGYEVTQTDDPLRVLKLVKSDPPDLIITDAALPDITCHEVIHLFRRHLPDVPVLMVSGLPDYEIMMRCNRERYEFFRKPFKAHQLRAKVREVLARAVARRSSAA